MADKKQVNMQSNLNLLTLSCHKAIVYNPTVKIGIKLTIPSYVLILKIINRVIKITNQYKQLVSAKTPSKFAFLINYLTVLWKGVH